MFHEPRNENSLTITDGEYLFEDIYKKPYFPSDHQADIEKANMLILPYENFRGRSEPLFPEETFRLFKYITEKSNGTELHAEICISDDEYKELELHADIINIAQIVIEFVVFPILTGILASYFYDKIKSFNRKDIDARVKITVTKGKRSRQIQYEGNIENFEKAMRSIDEINFQVNYYES